MFATGVDKAMKRLLPVKEEKEGGEDWLEKLFT